MGKVLSKISDGISSFFSKKWHCAITLPLGLLLIYALYFIFCYKEGTYLEAEGGYGSSSKLVAAIIVASIFVAFVIAVDIYLTIKHQMNGERLAISFLLISSACLLFYGGYKNFNNDSWKHDFGVFSEQGGHWSIFYDIYNDWTWPAVNLRTQYYQPKLSYAIMALFMHFNALFMKIPTDNSLVSNVAGTRFTSFTYFEYSVFESSRILLAFLGILTLYTFYRIFKILGLKGSKLAIATGLVSATPLLIYLPFSGNNDCMAFLFALLALYFALRYYKDNSFLNIVMVALFLALGMECKLNAALVALPIAYIFLLVLLRQYKKDENHTLLVPKEARKHFWLQIIVFALLVFPLGLAGPIYNKVVYNEPIGYVLDLEINKDGLYQESFMHISSDIYSPFMRFFLYPSPDLFWNIFNIRFSSSSSSSVLNPYGTIDFNVWTAFLKTSLWEENNLTYLMNKSGFLLFLFYLAYGLAIVIGLLFVIGAFIYSFLFLFSKRHLEHKFLFGLNAIIFLTFGGSYAYFCYKYPVGCTMNARYATFLYLPIYLTVSFLVSDVFSRLFPKKKEVSVPQQND